MRIRIRHTVLLLAIALLTVPQVIHAQWFGSKSDMINTLRVIVNGDWEQPAIETTEKTAAIIAAAIRPVL